MAITLSTSARNAACNAIVDLLDVGTGNPAGLLKIGTTGMATTLAQLDLSNPAFGNASTGAATANAISDDTSADNTGTAAEFQLQDRDRNTVWSGSVGTSGADINFNSASFVASGTVQVSSLVFTVPA